MRTFKMLPGEGNNYAPSWTPVVRYSGGSGTAEDPYLIYTAAQMNEIGANPADWNKHFKLMADIDLSSYTGTQFNIIGTDVNPFTGAFDGNNHTISNFTYTSSATDYVGLFRSIGQGSEIKNLGLLNVDVSGQNYVGGLVGYNYSGNILVPFPLNKFHFC